MDRSVAAYPRAVRGRRADYCTAVDSVVNSRAYSGSAKAREGRRTTMSPALALVADIGGTHARFALADAGRAAPLLMDSVRTLGVADFPSVVAAAQHYLRGLPASPAALGQAVFAVAGRVEGDFARITNHPWTISRPGIAQALRLPGPAVQLVNDFTAQAMATLLLSGPDLALVGEVPLPPAGGAERTYGVIGPGTGLGVSALLVRDGQVHPLETEGGHVNFAASTAEEAAIWSLLAEEFGRVSNERLLSGRGLCNIHRALRKLGGEPQPAPTEPRDITAGAAAGDATCLRAIEIFCEVFGNVAGDLVLTLGSWDGVFLTGGLVPKLLGFLQGPAFRRRFEAKGRFSGAMARVPVLAVMHPQAGLLGATALAMRSARD